MVKLIKIGCVLLVLTLPSIATAQLAGLGKLAEDMMEPVTVISDFIGTGSLVIGICCLFGAFLRYMQHRTNPMVAPISTVVVLTILGIALLFLPFIYKLTGVGVPYHLF